MSSIRRHVRMSLLAMMVSYLRDGVTSTANFTSYPRFENVYTFAFNGNVYNINMTETGSPFQPLGVTLQLTDELSEKSRAQPQIWDVTIRVAVRAPKLQGTDSDAFGISNLLDKAFSESGSGGAAGKVRVWDFEAVPPVDTGVDLSWMKFPRGDWKEEGQVETALPRYRGAWIAKSANAIPMQQLVMEFVAAYTASYPSGG